MKKAVIYTRVSTEEQTKGSHLSLETQELECRKKAQDLGYTVVKLFSDPGKNGKDFKRPGLIEMMNYVKDEKNKIEAVILLSADRLARSTILHKTVCYDLRQHKIGVKFVNGLEYDDTAEGEMIDTILASMNQYFRDQVAQKTMGVIKNKVLSGFFCSRAPLGYKNARDKNDKGVILLDEQRASLIKEIFDLYSAGSHSIAEITDIINEKGLKSFYGGRLHESKVHHILNNPFYYGKIKWGGMEVEKGVHQPLIDKKTFDACQTIMKSYSQPRCRKGKHDFLLRGFIFCHNCGCRYTAEYHYNKRIGYYHCCKRRKCDNRSGIEVGLLENKVEKLFKRIQFSEEFIQMIIDEVKIEYNERTGSIQSQKDMLSGHKKSLEAKRAVAEQKLLKGILDDDAFTRIRNEVNQEIAKIELKINEVEGERELDIDFIQEVLRLTADIYNAYVKAPQALKRKYLNFFWDKIVVLGKEIKSATPNLLFAELIKAHKATLRAQKTPAMEVLEPEIINNNPGLETATFAPVIAYHKTFAIPQEQPKVIISHNWGG